MSYNPNYGMPHQQQATVALPFPTDAFIATPVPIPPGNPPALPNIPYIPPGLQQCYPLIVSECMDAISAKANTNRLRVFLFNQMVNNNWLNNEFASFVDGAVKMLDMQMNQRKYPDVPTGAREVANLWSELSAAQNVVAYPALAGMIDSQMLQGVQNVLASLAHYAQQMQQFRQPQQQQMQPPPMHQPQQQNTGMWNQQAAPPAWSPQHQARQAPPAWRAQPHVAAAMHHTSAVAPSTTSIFSTGPNPAEPALAADRFSQHVIRQAPHNNGQTESGHAQNIQEARRLKEQQILNNVPAQPVRLPEPAPAAPAARQIDTSKLVLATEQVKWVPSERYFVNMAFDPNKTDLYYEQMDDGTTFPYTSPKPEKKMEMNKHLTVPSYVKAPPLGADNLDVKLRVFEMNEALVKEAAKIEHVKPIDLNVAYKDAAFHSSVCERELWFSNEMELGTMLKRDGKVNMFRACALLMDPLVTQKDPKPFIDTLAAAGSFAQAVGILKTAHNQLNQGEHEHLDAKTLTFLNKRLTQAVNEYLKKRMAVPLGWIDSFMEDSNDLIEFIDRKYGEAMRKALSNNQKLILGTALAYGDKKFENDQNNYYLPDAEQVTPAKSEEIAKLNYTYFYTYYTLTSLDLFSVELCVEVPTREISVGVFAQQTPLLRQIADNIFTHQKALDIEFNKHLLQTADGVVYQLTTSPLNSDFVLVSVLA